MNPSSNLSPVLRGRSLLPMTPPIAPIDQKEGMNMTTHLQKKGYPSNFARSKYYPMTSKIINQKTTSTYSSPTTSSNIKC